MPGQPETPGDSARHVVTIPIPRSLQGHSWESPKLPGDSWDTPGSSQDHPETPRTLRRFRIECGLRFAGDSWQSPESRAWRGDS